MTPSPIVLIIDDEIQIRRFLKLSLEAYGYKVIEAKTGQEGLLLLSNKPDIILLDLGLPDMEGKDFLFQLREWSTIPVIILTVKDSEKDKIMLLDGGADDYLTKPFSVGELQSRIKVALRHSLGIAAKENIFTAKNLKIDFVKRLVTVDDKEVKLTPTEYSLLCLLAKHAGKVVTQTQLMREIWNPQLEEETQYLRFFIMQLRKKIEKDPGKPQLIITELGIGYRLLVD